MADLTASIANHSLNADMLGHLPCYRREQSDLAQFSQIGDNLKRSMNGSLCRANSTPYTITHRRIVKEGEEGVQDEAKVLLDDVNDAPGIVLRFGYSRHRSDLFGIFDLHRPGIADFFNTAIPVLRTVATAAGTSDSQQGPDPRSVSPTVSTDHDRKSLSAAAKTSASASCQ